MVIAASDRVSAFLPADANHGEALDFLKCTIERGNTTALPNLALAEIADSRPDRPGEDGKRLPLAGPSHLSV